MSAGRWIGWLLFTGAAAALMWEHPGVWIPLSIGGFIGLLGD